MTTLPRTMKVRSAKPSGGPHAPHLGRSLLPGEVTEVSETAPYWTRMVREGKCVRVLDADVAT